MAATESVDALMSAMLPSYRHSYDERDVVLYALGLGCRVEDDLKYLYEHDDDFAALPTFAVIVAHKICFTLPLEHYIPKYQPARVLHGEQYLELADAALPSGATKVVTRGQMVDVQDKGRGAVAVLRTTSVDAQTGHILAINEFTSFCVGTGTFEGASRPLPRPAAAVAANEPPQREADVQLEAATGTSQAALYRLSGDYNPLHVDPGVAEVVGFPKPILHGLCSMGISVRLILRHFGNDNPRSVKSVKVRFAKHVFPGETLVVRCWAQPACDKVLFQTAVKERDGVIAISNAAVEFRPGCLSSVLAQSASGSGFSKL